MTVVVVGPFPPPVHGAARVTAAVTDLLRAAGANIRVVDTGVVASGWRYHRHRLLAHVRAAWLTTRVPAGSAVYLGGAGGLGLWYQLAVVAAARLRRLKVVFHHHSSQYLSERSTAMSLMSRLAGPHAVHVTLSTTMSRRLKQLYPSAGQTLQLSNAAFVDAGRPVTARPADNAPTLVVGHLSNLSRAKGLDEVLAAYGALHAGGVDVNLLLAGPVADAMDRRLVEHAVEASLGRITWVGALLPDEVPGFLAQLDVFLFPSRYRHEAEPLVVLEAASVGVPTVAFDVGSLHELVGQLGGVAVPPGPTFAEAVQAFVLTCQRVDSHTRRRKVQDDLRLLHRRQEQSLSQLVSTLTE